MFELYIIILTILTFVVPSLIIGIFLNINIINFKISENQDKEKLLVFLNWIISIFTGFSLCVCKIMPIIATLKLNINMKHYIAINKLCLFILAEDFISSCAIMTIMLFIIILVYMMNKCISYICTNYSKTKTCNVTNKELRLKNNTLFNTIIDEVYNFNLLFIKNNIRF